VDELAQADGYLKIDTKLNNDEFQSGLDKLKSAGKKVALAIGTAIGAALFKGMDFESGMSKVQAISGATGEALDMLTEKAKEMGAKTVFSATESAEAFQYMAMAGWKTEEMLSGIEGVMNLAAASGENLGLVSDIVTDALTAFGLKASDSAHFADVLAAASSNSNTNVAMMGDTFKYVAPIAGALGYTIEDTALAIGLMANAGIKSSQAGTSLRAMLSRLSKPTKEVQTALNALGISLTDASGNIKPLNILMQDLRNAFNKLDKAQKPTYAAMIAGQEAMSGLLAIVNASSTDFDKLTSSISKADGTAEHMAETMTDNLKGQLTILSSAAEGLALSFYDGIDEPLKKAVKSGTKSIEELTESMESGKLKTAMEGVGDLLANLVDLLIDISTNVIPVVISALGFLGKNTALVELALYSLIAVKVGVWATKASLALKELGNTMKGMENIAFLSKLFTPAGGAVAVATITAVTAKVIENNSKSIKESQKMMEPIEAIGTELDKLKEKRKELDEVTKENISVNMEEANKIESLYNQLDLLVDANGRVSETNKQRAEFILGELNNALGTEYKLTGDIIKNYDDLSKSITETIINKRLLAAIEGAEEKQIENEKQYVEYVKQRNEIEKQIAENNQKINELSGEGGKAAAERMYLVEANENLKASYEETGVAISEIESEMAAYGKLYAAQFSEDINVKEQALAEFTIAQQEGFKTSIKSQDDWLNEYKNNLALLNRITLEDGSVKEGYETVFSQAKIGLENSIQELVKSGMSIENLDRIAGEEIGKPLVEGMIEGATEQGYVLNAAIQKIILTALDKGKEAADIHSPSRLSRDELGKPFIDGVAVGIIDNGYKVLDAVESVFDDLDLKHDIGALSNDEYYAEMEVLRDKHIKKGTKQWWDYTKKLISYEEKKKEEAEKQAEDERKKKVDSFKKGNDEIIEQTERFYDVKEKLGIANEKDEAEMLRKQGNSYLGFLKQIETADFLTNEEREELIKKYTEKAQDSFIDAYAVIADSAKEKFDEIKEDFEDTLSDIEKRRDAFNDKLNEHAPIYRTVTFENANEGDESFVQLTDWKKAAEEINEYDNLLNSVIERGASDKIKSHLLSMGIEEGTKYAKALLNASDKDFNEYTEGYESYLTANESIAESKFQDEVNAASEAYKNSINGATDEILTELKEKFGDIPADFLTFGDESGQNFKIEFMKYFEAISSDMQLALDGILSDFKLSVDDIVGNNVTNNETQYNFYGTNGSVSENLQAAKNNETLNRMRGIG